MRRRVVITGVSALSPNGIGTEAYWDALFAGRSGIRQLSLINPDEHQHDCGGEIADFDPAAFLSARDAKRLGRAVQLALAAVRMAWLDARLDGAQLDRGRLGLIAGAAAPVMDQLERDVLSVFAQPGYKKLKPLTLARDLPHINTTLAYDALDGQPGYTMTVSMACCSGANAMALAAERIRAGDLDVVVAGAGDSTFSRGAFNAFEATRMMYRERRAPERIMRPFNADRDGGVLSEGAAYVVLEDYAHARARGARPYAEWVGHAALPPEHARPREQPARRGLGNAMQAALDDAGLRPEAVDYVCAHATSSPDTDIEEAQAIWDVFGRRTPRMPVSSIKSMIGNPIGAVGPLQVVGVCGAFRRGLVPPTINSTEVDAACRLDVVPNRARRNGIRTSIINIHGLDGANSTLVLGAPPNGSHR